MNKPCILFWTEGFDQFRQLFSVPDVTGLIKDMTGFDRFQNLVSTGSD